MYGSMRSMRGFLNSASFISVKSSESPTTASGADSYTYDINDDEMTDGETEEEVERLRVALQMYKFPATGPNDSMRGLSASGLSYSFRSFSSSTNPMNFNQILPVATSQREDIISPSQIDSSPNFSGLKHGGRVASFSNTLDQYNSLIPDMHITHR